MICRGRFNKMLVRIYFATSQFHKICKVLKGWPRRGYYKVSRDQEAFRILNFQNLVDIVLCNNYLGKRTCDCGLKFVHKIKYIYI